MCGGTGSAPSGGRGALRAPRTGLLAALSPLPRSEGRFVPHGPWWGEGLSAGGRSGTRRGATREAEAAGGVNGLAESRRGAGAERAAAAGGAAERAPVRGAGRGGEAGEEAAARAGAPALPLLNLGKAEAGRGAGAGGRR